MNEKLAVLDKFGNCPEDRQDIHNADNFATHAHRFRPQSFPVTQRLILASGSRIRASLLKNAGLSFSVETARIDEGALKEAAISEGMSPRDLADLLAEGKSRKVGRKYPQSLVIGCDQVLEFEGNVFSKPASVDDAREQLMRLSGKTHFLFSAAVIHEGDRPVWRTIGKTALTMRRLSEQYVSEYVARNWEQIRHTVGCYQVENEGVRLLSRIDGDFFNILGLPLLELLGYLVERGEIPG